MKPTKKGRQKKYPKMFTLRATEAEHAARSACKGVAVAALTVSVGCGLSNDAPKWEDRQQRERAIIQLIRAGNNLNQIATVAYQIEPGDHESNEGEGTTGGLLRI